MRYVTPVVILVAIAVARFEHTDLVAITLGVLAVILLITTIVLTRRQRRMDAAQSADVQQRDTATGTDSR